MPPVTWNRVNYTQLNDRQQEIANFAEISWRLSKFGWSCTRLTDDWGQADFLAQHIGGRSICVQLKSRLWLQRQYLGKNLWLGFKDENWNWYLGLHDELASVISQVAPFMHSASWGKDGGGYSWSNTPKAIVAALMPYRIPDA